MKNINPQPESFAHAVRLLVNRVRICCRLAPSRVKTLVKLTNRVVAGLQAAEHSGRRVLRQAEYGLKQVKSMLKKCRQVAQIWMAELEGAIGLVQEKVLAAV